MVRKYRCKNWPRAGISSVSRVSARSSRNESSTGICDITGSPGLGISNPLNLSIPQRGIGIADEFWKPQSNVGAIIHAPFARINRVLHTQLLITKDLAAGGYCGFQGTGTGLPRQKPFRTFLPSPSHPKRKTR